jgi:hypothetical protein
MLVSHGSVLITPLAPGSSVGQTRRQTFCQSLSTSYGNRERRSGFGRVTGSSLASRLSTVPTGRVRSSWDGLGTGAPPGLFYDNLRVFVAYKVIGRDLAIGFRGLG